MLFPPMQTYTIRLTDEIAANLRLAAKRRGIPWTQYAREILDAASESEQVRTPSFFKKGNPYAREL